MSNTDRKIQKVKKGKVTMGQSCRETSKKRLDLRRTKAGWRIGVGGWEHLLRWSQLNIYWGRIVAAPGK